jgi:hypothetical protein
MNHLIKQFKRFNRKERYYLIGYALGNPEFILSESFIKNMQQVIIGLKQPIPENSFAAMDYHIDWIYAALFLCKNKFESIHNRNSTLISANQEDIDFLVAFPDVQDNDKTHLVLCECKAESSWTNKQFLSKVERFRSIFGEKGEAFKDIAIPHFLLISPKKPGRLDLSKVPEWMKPKGDIPWMELDIPKNLQKVTRCNEMSKNSKDGLYWKVENTSKSIL